MRFQNTTAESLRRFWAQHRDKVASCDHLSTAAEAWVSSLYQEYKESLVLVRAFVTQPYWSLPDFQRAAANRALDPLGKACLLSAQTPILSLLGTRGVEPAWNDRRLSEGHAALPLLAPELISPMAYRLLSDLGVPLESLQTDDGVVQDAIGTTAGLYHVLDAAGEVDRQGRKVIPHQDFVKRYGVRSVFGIGGAFLGSLVLVLIFFSRDKVAREEAELQLPLLNLFKTVTYQIASLDSIFPDGDRQFLEPPESDKCSADDICTAMRMAADGSVGTARSMLATRVPSVSTPMQPGSMPHQALRLIDLVLRCVQDKEEVVAEIQLRQLETDLVNQRLRHEIDLREQVEAELRQAHKLESVGSLAAGIAHEINTPVQFIGDNTRFLKEAFSEVLALVRTISTAADKSQANGSMPERIEALKKTIEGADLPFLEEEIPLAIDQLLEGIGRISRIVSAMKTYAHPGSGNKEPVNLNEAIESTATIATNEWKYVAELTTDLDPRLPPVSCFRSEINQVVLAMIVNAAHSIAERNGSHPLKKGSIRIATADRGDHVEIRIADTGTGIPEEVREKIFDRFFTTKEVGMGTGQGLSIAHNIVVNKHSGSIGLETEMGEGTTFIVTLPV